MKILIRYFYTDIKYRLVSYMEALHTVYNNLISKKSIYDVKFKKTTST